MKKFLCLFLIAVAGHALADGPAVQTTPYTRMVLQTTNPVSAQIALGFTGTNLTAVTVTAISNIAQNAMAPAVTVTAGGVLVNASTINGTPLLTTNWNPSTQINGNSPLSAASISPSGLISNTNPLALVNLTLPLNGAIGYGGYDALSMDTNGNQFWGVGANWMQVHPINPDLPLLQINLGIGPGAIQDMATGSNNVALGADDIWRLQESGDNTAVGTFVDISEFYGNQNTMAGYLSCASLAGNSFPGDVGNTVIGSQTLWQAVDAQNSIVLGYLAGQNITGGITNSILIGNQGPAGSLTDTTWLGTPGVETQSYIAGNVIITNAGALGTLQAGTANLLTVDSPAGKFGVLTVSNGIAGQLVTSNDITDNGSLLVSNTITAVGPILSSNSITAVGGIVTSNGVTATGPIVSSNTVTAIAGVSSTATGGIRWSIGGITNTLSVNLRVISFSASSAGLIFTNFTTHCGVSFGSTLSGEYIDLQPNEALISVANAFTCVTNYPW